MKKTILFSGILACLAILLASCVRENTETASEAPLVEMSFNAGCAGGARSGFDGTDVVWRSGDMLSVFDASNKNRPFVTSDSGVSAQFSGRAIESGEYYALYPYLESNSMSAPGKVRVNFVSNQRVVPGSWADSVNLSMGKTPAPLYGSSLSMKNLGGYVQIDLGESEYDIVAMTLSAGAGEALTGPADVDYTGDAPVSVPASGASSSITLVPESGHFIPGTYYAVACPNSLADGLNLSLRRADNYLGVMHHASTSIPRNSFHGNVISVDPSQIEWQDPIRDTINVDFAVYEEATQKMKVNQPFTETLPSSTTVSSEKTDHTYYLKNSGYPFRISASYLSNDASYGLRMGGDGDYITLPAIPGKRLQQVKMVFGLNSNTAVFTAAIHPDSDGAAPVAGGERVNINYMSQGKEFTWNLTNSAEGAAHRLVRGAGATTFRMFSLSLIYIGRDVPQIMSVAIKGASLEEDTASISAEVTALHQDAGTIFWGTEYRLKNSSLWNAGPSGTGTQVNATIEGLEEDAEYSVRVWARADSYPPVYSEEAAIGGQPPVLNISLLPFNSGTWKWAGEGTQDIPDASAKLTPPDVAGGAHHWTVRRRYDVAFCRYELIKNKEHSFDYWSDADGNINISTSSVIQLPGIKDYVLTNLGVSSTVKTHFYLIDAPTSQKTNGISVFKTGTTTWDLNLETKLTGDAAAQPGVSYYLSTQNTGVPLAITRLTLTYKKIETTE